MIPTDPVTLFLVGSVTFTIIMYGLYRLTLRTAYNLIDIMVDYYHSLVRRC